MALHRQLLLRQEYFNSAPSNELRGIESSEQIPEAPQKCILELTNNNALKSFASLTGTR